MAVCEVVAEVTHYLLRLRRGLSRTAATSYLQGWSSFYRGVALWYDRAHAFAMSRSDAFRTARMWGPDWREVVRVVRVGRRRG